MSDLDKEDLNELSKNTLGNYIQKARDDSHAIGRMRQAMTADPEQPREAERLNKRRAAGINMAVKKLTKEDMGLDEAKATGEESISADAITPAGGLPKKRRADAFRQAGDPQKGSEVVTPQGTNTGGLHEMLAAVFGDQDLSEDFVTKATTLWEAALHEQTVAITEQLAEEFEEELTEAIEDIAEQLTDKLDSYLDYVVENWMEENEVALETGYTVTVAESILSGLKALVEDHNLEVDESDIDVLGAMEEELEESNSKYNEVVEELIAIREEKEMLERELVFKSLSEGMVDSDAERFRVLAEGVSAENTDEFLGKLEVIKGNYFAETIARGVDQTEYLEEEVETPTPTSPTVAAYVASLNRIAKNK
jgi:hypothetical protein